MGVFRNYILESKPVFFAIQYNPIDRSKQELVNEENHDLAEMSEMNKTQQSLNRIETQNNANVVMFNDHISGIRIQVALSHENIKRLQDRFNSEDFYQRHDNVIRLSGKAEAFVSGWFGDLAYRQNYLGADANNDGKIDRDEFRDLRIGKMGLATVVQGDVYATSERGYVTLGDQWYDYVAQKGETTLAGALNRTLQLDANLDGIRLDFEGQTQREIEYKLDKVLAIHGLWNTDEQLNPDKILMDGLKKLLEQQKLIEKLRQKNGDISSLTAEEKELLAAFVSKTDDLNGEEMDALQDKMHNQTLEDIAKNIGIGTENLRGVIIEAANALPNKNTKSLDSELAPVIDEMRSQIQNNAVVTLDVRA